MSEILSKFGKRKIRIIPDAALNAETPLRDLGGTVTPLKSFFVRNNGDLPSEAICDISKWVITLDGEVDYPQSFTLPQLRTEFQSVSLTAVLARLRTSTYTTSSETRQTDPRRRQVNWFSPRQRLGGPVLPFRRDTPGLARLREGPETQRGGAVPDRRAADNDRNRNTS